MSKVIDYYINYDNSINDDILIIPGSETNLHTAQDYLLWRHIPFEFDEAANQNHEQ